jgi:UDP-glucose 4-epimerase
VRTLVTGGAGFIGSSLVHVLLAAGHDVGVIDDLSTGKAENLVEGVWFEQLDILDPALPQAVAEFAPDAVVHLAAQASVPVSLKDPERDWAVNAEGTRVVARAAAQNGAQRMISASTAAVYGDPESVPLPETARTSPLNPYGRSKLAAEGLLAEELAGTSVDFASFRFANVYGPRQDAAGEGGVVALFLDAVAHGREPVVLGSGKQTRDFIYVADIASAILCALESGQELRLLGKVEAGAGTGTGGAAAYNISTGVETSVRRLAEDVRAATGYEGAFAHAPAREGDIFRSALDATRVQRVLGWEAGMELREGLELTWRWFAAQA